MIYFDKPFLVIRWDDDVGAVWVEWKELVEGEPFRSALEVGLSLLDSKKASKWLGDLTNLGPLAVNDQKWVNEIWFPRMITAGLRWMALVMPKKVVAQMSVKIVMSQVDDIRLETAYFDAMDQARDWLRSKP